MKHFSQVTFTIISIFILISSLHAEIPNRCQKAPCANMLVAHAGGIIHKTTYTNSLEALEKSYKSGFKFFEIDLNWTSDKKIVCLHDWKPTFEKLYGESLTGALPFKDFVERKTLSGVTPCTLETLIEWLKLHKDSYIITDIKSKNIEALARIAKNYSKFIPQFIPQIYNVGQYESVRKLNYQAIIFTLYANSLSDKEVLAFANSELLFAVTMTKARANDGLANELRKSEIFTYAHTINRKDELPALYDMGFLSYYTDSLLPSDILSQSQYLDLSSNQNPS